MRFEGLKKKKEFCNLNDCEFRLYYIFCDILLQFKQEACILWTLFIAKIVLIYVALIYYVAIIYVC